MAGFLGLKRSLWLAGLLMLGAQSAVADTIIDPNPQIHAMVQLLNAGPSATGRYTWASKIAKRVHDTEDKTWIRDETIDDIAGLLDDDPSAIWVASALGQIGPTAKRAVPSLEATLEREHVKNEACLAQLDVPRQPGMNVDLSCLIHIGPPPLSEIVCRALLEISGSQHPMCEVPKRG